MADIQTHVSSIIKNTDEYLKIPSVVDHERPFLSHLYKEYEGLGYTVVRADNIVAVSGNKPDSAYLSAHVDRHGILSIDGDDYRYSAHAVKNYEYNEDIASQTLSHLETVYPQFETEGVYAYGHWSGEIISKGYVELCNYCTRRSNLIFKIEDMDNIPEGIPVAYAYDNIENNANITGQIDNVLSGDMIFGLFQEDFQGTAIFTAEDEIDKNWKHLGHFLQSQNIEIDRLIVLDTSSYDSSSAFNVELVETLKTTCDELDRFVYEYKERRNSAPFQIPTFNYPTNHETTTQLAVTNIMKLLSVYCKLN